MRLTFLLFFSILTFFAFANDDFVIRSFDVDIEVLEDGSFQIQEKIKVFFYEKRRGIYRDIPIKYQIAGESKKITIENVTVDDYKYKTQRKGNKYSIRIGDKKIYVKGEQEYVLNYRVRNGILFHADFLEFYWNITGNGWEVPMESASFELRFPDSVQLKKEDIKSFSGSYGHRSDKLSLDIESRSIIGKTSTPLGPLEGISIATKLSKSDFTIPEPLPDDLVSQLSRALKKEKLFSLPLLILGILISWFKLKGRRKQKEIIQQFYPPENFSPTELGYFYDHHVHDRDLMALIPKWGNEGLISMEVIGLDSDDHKVYFHKIGDLQSTAPSYERTFFDGLFKNSNVIKLEDLKGEFYKIFAQSKREFSQMYKVDDLYDQQAKATFHNPWYHLIWALLIGLGIFSMIQAYVLTGIGLFALALVGFIITISRPRLSDRGFEIHAHLEGLKRFLESPTDAGLTQVMKDDPQYLNRILPYVVAFGLDRSWEERIKNLRPSDPEWYYGSGMNNDAQKSIGFTDGFNVRDIRSAFVHSPASSSGSSSSGGFSGGGLGGGGGGSW